ncbi:transposase [Streptomyces sp. NPDC099050]|uniref:transposase n=1 Tax=Streptomyces sp. NPDC099050 TaxID=3366100 RepID=UPI0037FBF70D
MLCSYARGLTHGEISAHLSEVYGAEDSKQTISTITDKVVDGMNERQNRPPVARRPRAGVGGVEHRVRSDREILACWRSAALG